MNWEDRMRKSDAGRLMPEKVEEIISSVKEKEVVKPDTSPEVLTSAFV